MYATNKSRLLIYQLQMDVVYCQFYVVSINTNLQRKQYSHTGFDRVMVGLPPNWVRFDPEFDKSGNFSDQISVHLAHRAKCTEI